MTEALHHPWAPTPAIAHRCADVAGDMSAARRPEEARPKSKKGGLALGGTPSLLLRLQTIEHLRQCIEWDQDCAEVLERSFRVQRALRGVDTLIVQRHLETLTIVVVFGLLGLAVLAIQPASRRVGAERSNRNVDTLPISTEEDDAAEHPRRTRRSVGYRSGRIMVRTDRRSGSANPGSGRSASLLLRPVRAQGLART